MNLDPALGQIFRCCHPALPRQAQIALALQTVGGLSTKEIGRAFVLPEATMARLLAGAKHSVRGASVPADEELPGRLAAAAAAIYLIFNEGYAATDGADHVRPRLTGEAIRLARLLAAAMPDEPPALGLLALLLLQDARRASRLDDRGRPVPLPDQDRSRWDRRAINEGTGLLELALRRTRDRPDQYVLQAAIAACHTSAPCYADTDWDAIISCYDKLLSIQNTAVVRLNRAVAVAERDGPAAGLALVDAIDTLRQYPWWHITRAELLRRMGRTDESHSAYREALALPLSRSQASYLREQLAR